MYGKATTSASLFLQRTGDFSFKENYFPRAGKIHIFSTLVLQENQCVLTLKDSLKFTGVLTTALYQEIFDPKLLTRPDSKYSQKD